MSENTLLSPHDQDKRSRSYATEPLRHVEYATLPPDVTLKPNTNEIPLKHTIFVVSTATMVIISLITFWVPLFNGLLAGAFGGYHAGRMKRALAAAAVNSVMVPAIIAFAHLMSEQPALLFLSGLTFWGWVALHVIGTFIGAITGAASRPLITERNMARYAYVNAARTPRSDAAPERSRSETSAVPPNGPVRAE